MPESAVEDRREAPDFGRVYEAEAERVYHRLRRLGVADRDLEDKMHDVFVVVHQKLSEYDPSRPITPWIAGITVRVAADHFKRAFRKREVMQTDVDERHAGPDPEAALQTRQEQRLLLSLLDELEPDRRALVVLHDLEGYEMPEIAELLQVGVNTLYSRLRMAREQLAKELRLRQKGGRR